MSAPAPDTSPASLAGAILAAAGAMTGAEQARLKGLLCLAACKLVPDGALPTDPHSLAAFRSIVRSLARMQPHADRLPASGIAYHGRPAFLTDDLLDRLRAESAAIRRNATREEPFCLGLLGGPVAEALARSTEMRELVAAHAGPLTTRFQTSYLYYEHTGHWLPAHVDDDIYGVNANIMLRHTASGDRLSYFYAFGADDQVTRIRAVPGEIVLMFGDSVVHGRAPLAAGELVNNMSIGFAPQG